MKTADYIQQIMEEVDHLHGTDFFEQMCIQLNEIIDSDVIFIARFDSEERSSQALAVVVHSEPAELFSHPIQESPCAVLLDNNECIYTENVQCYFSKDLLLKAMNIEGYIGAPLINTKGKVCGVIAAMYEQAIRSPKLAKRLLKTFTGRISCELERDEYERSLTSLNERLEEKVCDRTKQLTNAMQELEVTQRQLVEAEKLAALGDLVSGIAHEVNTPLGVAITAQSHLQSECNKVWHMLKSNQLRKSVLEKFVLDCAQSLRMVETNLERAGTMIGNFKQISADQHNYSLEKINLKDYYRKIIDSLKPLLKSNNGTISFHCDKEYLVRTYPGVHVQVLANLCKNSVQHGFAKLEERPPKIEISIKPDAKGYLVAYDDNGTGVSEDDSARIFEPFFTTDRSGGGTGLGMSITYNLITKMLAGRIQYVPKKQPGAKFLIWFPSIQKASYVI